MDERMNREVAQAPNLVGDAPAIGKVVLKGVGAPNHEPHTSLDTNGDGIVGMAELNPPRPESGHDLAVAGGAAVVVAAATALAMGAQRMRQRRPRP